MNPRTKHQADPFAVPAADPFESATDPLLAQVPPAQVVRERMGHHSRELQTLRQLLNVAERVEKEKASNKGPTSFRDQIVTK